MLNAVFYVGIYNNESDLNLKTAISYFDGIKILDFKIVFGSVY